MKPFSFLLVLTYLEIGNAFIVPKLLLPYYDHIQVNYTINAEEGCYKWRSLNPGIASIQPIPKDSDGCTTSAVVYVESKVPARKITLILAENALTGTILQCDVIIDKIHSIDIISRTRELYLEDPPETLKIRALDDEGNTFSSTAYMLYDWSLLHDSEGLPENQSCRAGDPSCQVMPAHTILRIAKFIDTEYKAEPYVEEMEKEGLQSDTILLSGLQTGSAFVGAKLATTTELKTAKIRLTVRDKVFLIPSGNVFLPQHGTIRYLVEQWRNGRSTEIKMPNQQYFLKLSNPPASGAVVSLDQQTSIAIGLAIGHSELFLMDRNLKQQTVQATSDIYVTEPAYLKFSIHPHDRWVLETGRFYIINVHVYDKENNRLWPSSNIRITTNIDSYHFKLLDSSKNGTWHSVQALEKGSTEVYAKLHGIIKLDGKMKSYHPLIEAVQVAEIFDPIVVKPPIVVFPWQPKPIMYTYQLRAEGGSGNYTWNIGDDQFSLVTSTGFVMTKIGIEQEKVHKFGSAVVRATDVRNSAHWGSSDIRLLPVVEIMFARSYREAEIGQHLDIYLVMFAQVGKELVPVVDCRESGVTWEVQDSTVFYDISEFKAPLPDPFDGTACIGRRLKALREGHTTVEVNYVQKRPDGSSARLRATATIAAFPPLIAIDPPELAVVSLDSTKVLRFKGGPIRWPLWHAGYERKISVNNLKRIHISSVQLTQLEHRAVSRCVRLGDAEVRLLVHNKPCNSNPVPIQAFISVRVLCAVPSRVELSVPMLLPSCPLHNTDLIQTVALVNRQLAVNVTAYDSNGNMFDNFTSVDVEWSMTYEDEKSSESISFFTAVDGKEQTKHIVSKVVSLREEGEQMINVDLPRYISTTDPKICEEYNCSIISPSVSGSVGVLVVAEASVSPPNVLLYNHENCSSEVVVTGGSGYFSYEIQQDGNISNIIERKNTFLKVAPVRAGRASLLISDLCLSSVTTVVSEMTVIEVGRLHLKAPSRMELHSWSEATVSVIDNFGNEIPFRFLSFIVVQLVTSVSDVIATDSFQASPSASLEVVSNLNAGSVGSTMLSAVARLRDGRVVKSNAVRIVVFPGLELIPSVITLIRHASYQLQIVGGPRSDFTIEYSVSDTQSGVVSVSQSGVVHALALGNTTVSARAIMHDGTVFHCKAPSWVKVVQLAGIRIDSPLTQFHVGGTVPLHVSGLDDEQNPLSFGSASPSLLFDWETTNPSVARLHTVHATAGVETSQSLSFTILAEGTSPGHSVVRVRVSAEKPSLQQLTMPEFSAEMSLMIFDSLSLSSTSSKQWKSSNNFLMTPETSHSLHTTRDGVAKLVVFQVLQDGPCDKDMSSRDENGDECVTMEKNILISHDKLCQTTLLITSVERFGINQTLAVHIMVRPVSYIIAKAITKFRVEEHTPVSNAFPLSSTVHFVVDQFDDAGYKFDATSHDVILNQNRFDIIEVEPDSGNRSFVVRLPLEGTTIMSVSTYLPSASSPTAVYYFPVHVLSAVIPKHQTLVIGLKFCFKSEFVNVDGGHGVWTTPNPKGLLVDEKSGAVVALAKSPSEVIYTVDSFKGRAQVTVSSFVANFIESSIPANIISVERSYVLLIRISPSYRNTDPIKCRGLENEMEKMANVLFQCSVSFRYSSIENVYTARPQYLAKQGSFACVIERRTLSEADKEALAVVDDHVTVQLESRSREFGTIEHGEAALQFIPAFTTEVSSTTLVLGSHISLCIQAIPIVFQSLQVTPCDTAILEVKVEPKDTRNRKCYKVQSRSTDPTLRTANVRVVSSLTTQDIKIDLILERPVGRYALRSSSCSHPDESFWRSTNDASVDSYLPYITTAAVVIVSTALLIAAFTAFRWVNHNAITSPSTSFLNRSPPPYDGNVSMSPMGQRTPGGSPRVKLWSRYYQPQQASPNSG